MRLVRLKSARWRIGQGIRVGLGQSLRWPKEGRHRLATKLANARALLWQRANTAQQRYYAWRRRYGHPALAVVLLLLIAASAFFVPTLHELLYPHFSAEPRLATLRALYLTLGGALIGAAAIVASLVLFAMQINIDRMPHGLFRRLSADALLLSAFMTTFVLALTIAGLSLVGNLIPVGATVFVAIWSTGLILLLFLYCYRRALHLVNPLWQLEAVIRRTTRRLQTWAQHADRAATLLSTEGERRRTHNDPQTSHHDLARARYFQANQMWTDDATQGVRYAASLARHYAEHGDHEVSAAALKAIIAINRAYIEAKGRTFFANQPFISNPLASDAFIDDTLEHLRQITHVGIARGDEQQIGQTLNALATLTRVYLAIDYGRPHLPKSHAYLAAGYLCAAVERVVPHNMPDVVMEGLRCIGGCAQAQLAVEGPEAIGSLTEKIGVISGAGTTRKDFLPITSTGVEQLARLSERLLHVQSGDVAFAAEKVRGNIEWVAKLLMQTHDGGAGTSVHSFYLAPYYSSTSTEALLVRLSRIVSAIARAPEDDANARRVIENFERWADQMFMTEKELFLHAISRRSGFTFDIVRWITTMTKMLLAVSNAAACDNREQHELRKHADYLITVLDWVPDDTESVRFVETYRVTETLFESALEARRRGAPAIAENIQQMFVRWLFKAGQYRTGWAVLERSVYGLATLALIDGDPGVIAQLRTDIRDGVAAGRLPDKGVCDDAALNIRRRAATLYRPGYRSSTIEQTMLRLDHARLRALIEEIADLVSPETSGRARMHGLL